MITILQGNPGHGKSYSLVREIAETVRKGQPVATNVPLRSDWAEVMARHYTLFGRWRADAVSVKAAEYRKLVHVSEDLGELRRVRLAGKGEGRGKLILDETHREMNARVDRTSDRRLQIIAHASGHRHYGFDMVLATQDEKNIDTQVRGLAEFYETVRNLKRVPFFGALIRFNLFVRTKFWSDKAKSKGPSRVYTLSKKLAALYDTHALAEVDWPTDAIVLPRGAPCNRPHGPEPKPPPPEPAPVKLARRTVAGADVRDSYAG